MDDGFRREELSRLIARGLALVEGRLEQVGDVRLYRSVKAQLIYMAPESYL